MAANRATFMRKARRLVASFLPLVLAVSTLSAISVVTAPSAQAAPVTAGGDSPTSTCNQEVGNSANVVSTRIGNNCIIEFKNTGTTTWRAPTGIATVQVMVVGGGGAGGGTDWTGGGGAGGVITASAYSVTANTDYSVVVGGGGASVSTQNTPGSDGGNSSFDGKIAKGGGGGAGYGWNNAYTATGRDGGSGGGSAEDGSSFAPGSIPSGGASTQDIPSGFNTKYGSRGGNSGNLSGQQAGGGGGGAGGAGGDVTSNSNVSGNARTPGNGGNGVSLNMGGKTFNVAAGGGGASATVKGVGGSAGGNKIGGDGARANSDITSPENGVANTGSGGGGTMSGVTNTSGAGGSGIVVIAYVIPVAPDAPTISRVVSTATSAAITYAAPANTGTSSITSYLFEISTNNGSTWSSATCATNVSNVCTITGLTLNPHGLSRHQYRVSAINAAGTSPASAAANGWFVDCGNPPVPQLGNGDYNYLKEAVSVVTYISSVCSFQRSLTNFTELGTAGSGSQTVKFDPAVNSTSYFSVSGGVFWTGWTLLNNASPTNVPTFGTASNSATTATIQVSNFDSSFTYSVTGRGCSASINSSTGLISASSYTNLSCSIQVTTSKTGFAQAWSTAYVGGNRFSVSFQGNSNTGGSMSAQIDGSGATINLTANAFTQDGYTFSGWNTLANGTGTAYANQAPYAFTANIVLRAQWTANTNNAITYNNQSATTAQSGGSTTYTTGSAIATIPTTAPLRTGFTFAGWYTASTGGTQVTDGSYTPPSPFGTVTLFAQWTADTNNAITYDNQSATTTHSGGSTTYTSAAAIATIPTTAPLRTNFTFVGWFTASSGGTQVTNGSYTPPSPYGTVTLYAQWLANAVAPTIGTQPTAAARTVGQAVTFTVAATASDSGVLSYQWQKGGSPITGATSASYTFTPVSTSDAGEYRVVVTNTKNSTTAFTNSSSVKLSIAGTNNHRDFVSSTPGGFTATGRSFGSSSQVIPSGSFTIEGWFNESAVLSNPNPLFSQGSLNANQLALLIEGATNNRRLILYDGLNTTTASTAISIGKWNHYAVTYDGSTIKIFLNGAEVASKSSPSFSVTTGNFSIGQNNYHSGHFYHGKQDQFKVWTAALSADEIASSMHAYGEGSVTGKTLRTLYDFNLSSGNDLTDVLGTFNLTGAGTGTSSTWASSALNVTFVEQGGSPAATVTTFDFYTRIANPGSPTKTGFTFSGWSRASDGNVIGSFPYIFTPLESVTLYAIWSGNSNTVTFNANDGSGTPATSTQSITSGTATALTANAFTRTGYAFNGWNTNADGTSGTGYSNQQSVTLTGGLTLFAKWIQTFQLTVTQSSNGTISPSTTVVNSGSNQTFTFTPSAGYNVSTITVNGTALTGSNLKNAIGNGYTFTNITATHTITATYASIVTTGLLVNLDATNATSLSAANGATAAGWASIAPGGSITPSGSSVTASNGTTGVSPPPRSVYFGGSSSYLNYGKASNVALSSNTVTVETWLNLSTVSNNDWDMIASKWFSGTNKAESASNVFHFGFLNSRLNVYARSASAGSCENLQSSTTFNSSQYSKWIHVAFTIDASGVLKFYLNGVEDGSHTGCAFTDKSAALLFVGDPGSSITGSMSRFRMYNSALSATDIKSNYMAEALTFDADYLVNFNYNSATSGNTLQSASFRPGGTAITLPTPSRTNFTFGGWYVASDFSGTALGSTYSPTSSLTIYAKWTGTLATLSGLTLSSGTLSATFASATTSYTASVANSVDSITITPTRSQENATITVNGTAVTSGAASGAIALNVGSNTITVVVTAQSGSTTGGTYTLTVTRAAGISTVALTIPSFTFTGSPQGPDINDVTKTGSTGAVTFAYVGRGGTSYLSSSTKPTNVGTYTVTATVAADSNFASVSASGDFAIVNASLVVTPTISASSMVFGTSSGLPTISHSKNPNVALTTNPTCTLHLASDSGFATAQTISSTLAVGSYVVRCTGAALTNYTISYGTNPSFSVTKANQSAISLPILSATSKTFPYSQTSLAVTSVTGGSGDGALSITSVVDGTATGCTWSGTTLTASTAGTCTLTVTKAASANFEAATTTATFTFNLATQSISITSTAPTGAKVAGATYGLTATGGASGNAVTFTSTTTNICTVATATVSFLAVGTCSLSANQASSSGYSAATAATQSFSVAKGDPALSSFANVTKVIGDSAFTLTAPTIANSLAGAFTYASGTVGTATISTATVTIVAAGTSVITATFTPTDGTNYNAATITMTLTVNNIYTVTYSYNSATGGNATVSDQFTQGGTAITLPTPSRTGYGFDGWYEASNLSGTKLSSTYSPTQSRTIYAKWIANTNNAITYDNQGATTAHSGGSTTYTTASAIATIPTTAPLKTNYSFLGWYTESSGGTRVTSGSYTPPSPFGSITLYAQWSNTPTITAISATSASLAGDLTSVVITGTNLGSTTGVTIGNVTATIVGTPTSTSVSLSLASSSISGSKDLVLTNAGGTVAVTNSYEICGTSGYFFIFNNTVVGTNKCVGTVVVPNGVVDLAQCAFANAIGGNCGTTKGNSITTVSLPTSLRSIYSLAFSGVSTITSIDLPEGLTFLGFAAFYLGGTYSIRVPSTVTTLNGSFRTSNVSSITFAESSSLTSIINETFRAVPNVYSLVLPDSVTTISGSLAFSGIPLATLTMRGVTSIAAGILPGTLTCIVTSSGNTAVNGYSYSGFSTLPLIVTNISSCPQPTITSLSVTSGASTGATSTVITGTHLINTTGVTVGGNAATITAKTTTSVTITTPAGSVGARNVVVTTEAGSVTGSNAFTYTKTLTVTLDKNFAGSTAATVTVASNATLASPTALTRSGYTFGGWSTTTDGTAVSFTGGYVHGQTDNFTLYAIWTVNSLTITFNAQGGSSVSSGTVNVGASISSAPTVPTRAGYSLSGWSATSTGSVVTFPYAHGQTANFTLYAIWTADSLSVTYNSNGGTSVTTGSVNTGASISSAPTPPTRTGYTFSGWSATDGGTVISFPYAHGQTASFALFAVWAANALTVTYDSQGGSAVSNGSVNTGASIASAPTVPTRAGYTLTGWSTTTTGSVVTFPYAHGQTASFTLYAIWSANALTVTYDSKGGSAVTSGTVNTAASISSAPTAPTRTGYTFSAWSATDGGTAITFPHAHGKTANFTLFALWTAGSLVITYDAKGGTSVSNGSTSSGTSISTAPTAPTRTGYTFSGWSATETGTVVTFPLAHGQTTNFTLYAIWSANTLTVAYDEQSGSSISDGTVRVAADISAAPTAPTRAGYSLTGWSTTSTGSVVSFPYAHGQTDNFTLYAIWAAVSCSPTTTTTGGYTIYTFTTAGTCFWTVPNGLTDVEILAVAGGGGGGYSYNNSGAGGGAGGQVKTGTATLSTTLEVTVGAGGSAGIASSQRGGNGTNSVVSTITALGGTGGCASRATTCSNSAQATSSAAANGGIGGAGGGSGRGGGGSNTTGSLTSTTAGGAGTASTYSGSSVTYGAGGAGGTARATLANIPGTAGSANPGNGGAGASAKASSGDVSGGAGGTGLVIVRVASALTITFNSQSGSDVAAGSTATGGSISAAPTAPTRANYSFLGWFTATSGGTAIAFPYAHGETANFTLYAQWTLNTYAITFNTNNGSGSMGNQTFTHGVAVNLNANLYSRANYVFHRWATAADGTGTTYNNLAQVTLTAATTLYAQWTANTYVVTYSYNGGDGGDSTATASFTTAGTAITLPVPTRTGFTFAGWHSDAALTTTIGSSNGSGTYSPTGGALSLNAYAKWTAVNYTFTYNSNSADSGDVPTETSKQITQTATVKANTGSLVRAGYTFNGWNTASNGTGTNYLSGSLFTVASANVILYAKWTANTYTVTYNTNGGTGNAQRSSTNVTSDSYTTGGASVVFPGVGTLERTGYTFAGWNTSAAGTGTDYAATNTYTTVSNVIFYVKWNPVTYTITYNGNFSDGGTAPTTGGYTTGQASPYVVLANSYTKTSSIFGGWNTAGNGTGTSYSPGASITTLANIVLYAVWIPQFTLHYAINGGTVTSGSLPADALLNINTAVTVFSALGRTGYTFGGWTNGVSTIAPGGSFNIVQDSVLTAKWTAINYSISYNSDGGTEAPATSTKQIGQSFSVGTAVSKPGYNFTGWSNGSTVVGADAVIVMGSANIAYTAQWVARVYTVAYDWNGGRGTAVSDVNYTFGTTAITLPLVGDRVRDGYTFTGWSESSGGSALSATYIPSQSRTLYALWTIGNFTVTYNLSGGTLANASAAVQNGSATVLPLPTRANFVFDGWHTATVGGSSVGSNGASFTPTASQTVYARWIQSSLYGITNSLTRIGSVVTVANVANTFSGANSSSSVSVSVPQNALPAGTTINFDMVGNSSRATGLLPNVAYLISIAISWLTADGLVPDTTANNPISVVISNATIKAGAAAYAIVNNVSTLLGTASQDGTITIALTSDPEVVIAATKPDAPTSVAATSNGNQQSVISWSAPASNGGSAITGYTVTASPGAGTCTTSTTSCTISSLTNGTAYTFTVTATNSVGTSVASTSASATTASLFAVTFDAKSGTAVTSGSFLTASTVSEPTAPTRTGYSFAGWSATDGGSAITYPYAPGVTAAITLFARWDALDNAVTFDSKSGSDVTAALFSSGGTVVEPTAPTRSGFTFAGWSATDGGSAVTFPYAPGVVTDITLYARWTVISQNNSSGSGGGSSTPAPSVPSEPAVPSTPVRSNVTVVAPVTVIGDQDAKVIAVDIAIPAAGSNTKPPVIKIDKASEKFIAEVKVVEGKLVLTPETGFSGKKTITVTITENGADRIVQIPLTVLPEAVTKPVLTPTASNRSNIRWTASPNADAYTVYLNGKKVCSTSALSCSVKTVLGPDANIEIVSNGGDRTVSQRVDAEFRQTVPVAITRLVSATITKSTLTRVDTKALDKVIALIKVQGFGTVVISEITTTSKTKTLAAARIESIKKYINSKIGTDTVEFEITPVKSRTYFNNISVKG